MNTYSCLFLMNMYRACQTGMYRLICTDHNPSWIRVHRYINTDCTAYLIIIHQHISHLIHYLTSRNKFTVTVCMIIQTQGILKVAKPDTYTRDAQSSGLKTMLKHDSPHSPHVQKIARNVMPLLYVNNITSHEKKGDWRISSKTSEIIPWKNGPNTIALCSN